MKRFWWVVVVGVLGALDGACDKPKPLPSDGESEGADPAARAKAFASMSAKDRAQAGAKLALAGDGADPDEVEAWLRAAQSEAERAALQQSSRPRFAAEYAKVLESKQKPGRVSVSGADGATLLIESEHCNKFLLENFAGAPEARTAKQIGFTRLACKSKALELAAEL